MQLSRELWGSSVMSEGWGDHCYLVEGNEILVVSGNKDRVTLGSENQGKVQGRKPIHTEFSDRSG